MEKLIDFFIVNFNTEKIWIAFLCLAIYYVFKKEPFKIFAHYSEKKEREHELALSLIESEKLGKDANEFLREHLEQAAFLRYYRINAYSEMRSALFKFQKKHQKTISWRNLRLAYPNIGLNGPKLSATLKWYDHFFRWLVTVLSFLVGSYAVLVIVLAIAYKADDPKQLFVLTIAAFVLLVAALLFSSQNWPYHSTRKIIAEIESDEK